MKNITLVAPDVVAVLFSLGPPSTNAPPIPMRPVYSNSRAFVDPKWNRLSIIKFVLFIFVYICASLV